MNIRANSSFAAGNFAKLEAAIVPRLIAAVETATTGVLQIAIQRVPVDTGELASSGGTEVEWKGKRVEGAVAFSAGHSAYVEFGTGIRGAEGPNAGEGITYSPTWPGMVGKSYLRSSLDESKDAIKGAFEEQGFST